MLTVTHFYREPRATGVSMEGIFRTVKADLAGKVEIREFYCDGKLSRLANTRKAATAASEVNHITGDVNFLAVGLRGRKVLLTVHDLGFYENPVHNKLKKTIYRLFWYVLPLRYTHLVTVVSEFTKAKLIQHFGFPASRIRVIPNPVKPIFEFVPKVLPSGHPTVLMLGTGKHKNLDNLILAAKDTDMHLDIVGWPAPDELAKLKEFGISHSIYNKLSDEEVLERYIACDLLFIASHYEGFGMPIIEAQAVGRPVVTSNIGAMREVGEGSALLVDPNSPDEIREAILSIAKDTNIYDDLVAKGRQNAARYAHERISAQYLEVYRELAAMK
ncbi:MAG: glycosyltransferase family 4 protein [Taibaiella sp.]|nr:glycosyltransferase family 4 protein [Taibaiella sp.]